MKPKNAFVYFLPKVKSATDKTIRDFGLDYAFDGLSISCRETVKGPDGGSGVVVMRSDGPAISHGYFEERQEWIKCLDSDAWVGCDREQRPVFEDLVRNELVPGPTLETTSGNAVAPVAQMVDIENDFLTFHCCLPQRLGLNAELRRFVPGGVERRFERLWELAELYVEAEQSAASEADQDGMYSFEFPQLDEVACLALQANYRLSMSELHLMEVWSESLRTSIIRALLDKDNLEAWLKKKLAGSLGSVS